MRICIFGAGAIGGLLAVRLARTGQDVSIVARGAHLAAIQSDGLRLISEGGDETVQVRASADPADLGVQDYVVVTLKAHSLPGIAASLAPLIGPDTCVVTAMNGVPYWYFHGLEGQTWRVVEAVDPGGVLSAALPPERALGCVVYPAAEVEAPGVIRHVSGDRFTLGEPDGTRSARATALSDALRDAGFKAPVRPRIRDEIWVKLWGNLAFNPISALTGATLEQICGDPATRALARAMMLEGQAVAEALGVRFAIDVDKRIEGAAAVGAHKTSMLQDLERGRPMEIDALVRAVVDLGALTGQPVPLIEAVLALVAQRARLAGCLAG